MIAEELKKIKSFGSNMESSVTPEDIADKEAELGFTLPRPCRSFTLLSIKMIPFFRQRTGSSLCMN